MLSALVFPKIVCAGSDILGFYEETIPGEEIGAQQSVVACSPRDRCEVHSWGEGRAYGGWFGHE